MIPPHMIKKESEAAAGDFADNALPLSSIGPTPAMDSPDEEEVERDKITGAAPGE